LLNGIGILAFAAGGLWGPMSFWALFGVDAVSPQLARLMSWYLGTFGLGAVLVARAPERQPLVVALVGIEKIGAATAFAALQLSLAFSLPLTLIGAFDALMAVVLIRYAVWLSGLQRIQG
jgi:hypothetical protein